MKAELPTEIEQLLPEAFNSLVENGQYNYDEYEIFLADILQLGLIALLKIRNREASMEDFLEVDSLVITTKEKLEFVSLN